MRIGARELSRAKHAPKPDAADMNAANIFLAKRIAPAKHNPARGFLPWRFPDAGRLSTATAARGTGIRKPHESGHPVRSQMRGNSRLLGPVGWLRNPACPPAGSVLRLDENSRSSCPRRRKLRSSVQIRHESSAGSHSMEL